MCYIKLEHIFILFRATHDNSKKNIEINEIVFCTVPLTNKTLGCINIFLWIICYVRKYNNNYKNFTQVETVAIVKIMYSGAENIQLIPHFIIIFRMNFGLSCGNYCASVRKRKRNTQKCVHVYVKTRIL